MANPTNPPLFLNTRPYLVIGYRGQMLRFELVESQHILGRDPACADLIVPSKWTAIAPRQVVFDWIEVKADYKLSDRTSRNSSPRDYLIARRKVPDPQNHLLQHGTKIQISLRSPNSPPIQITYLNPSQQEPTKIKLQGKLSIGSAPNADIFIENSPVVLQRHANIDVFSHKHYILHSSPPHRPILVNGRALNCKQQEIVEGDRLQIGPQILEISGNTLLALNPEQYMRVDADGLVVKKGRERPILNRISLAIEPGHLVAIVGCGRQEKSLLLRALLGIEPLREGNVRINGQNLEKSLEKGLPGIGYISQERALCEWLTARETLNFAAKLRLASDLDTDAIVEKVIKQIKPLLSPIFPSDELVRNLSSEQRLGLSLAIELLANPRLLLLDDPTANLHSGAAQSLVNWLKNYARVRGGTVIFSTEITDSLHECDRLAVLGNGGQLCYFGTPQAALAFFQTYARANVQALADIYAVIAIEGYAFPLAQTFWESPDRVEFIDGFRPHAPIRGNYNRSPSQANRSPTRLPLFEPSHLDRAILPLVWQQFEIWWERNLRVIWRDRWRFIGNSVPGLASILLLAIFLKLGEPLPALENVVWLLASGSAIATGLATSIQETEGEFATYERERLLDLNLVAYLGAKLGSLGILASLQALAMSLISYFFSLRTEAIPWSFDVTTYGSLFGSASLGLLVWAIANNASQARNAIAFIILLQLLGAGVVVPLTGKAQLFAYLSLSYWSVEAYTASKATELAQSILGLLGHACGYFLLTWAVRRLKDRWGKR